MITSLELRDDLVLLIDARIRSGNEIWEHMLCIPEEYLSTKGKKVLDDFKKDYQFAGSSRSAVITSILEDYFKGDPERLFKKELEPKPTLELSGKPLTYSEQQFSIRRSAPSSYNVE
jgi:hypothetical protein